MPGFLNRIFFVYVISCLLQQAGNFHYWTAEPLQLFRGNFFQVAGRAQGTTYSIRYRHAFEVLPRVRLDSIFKVIDHSLSIYDSGSLISRFNRSRDGVEADSHLLKVVRLSREFHARGHGAFDITLLPLSALWGFGPGGKEGSPTDADVKRAILHTGMELISITGNYIRKNDPFVQIDCNGIAQGYTVDILADYLSGQGVTDYMVELGGEIRVHGMNEGGMPWTIGIELPGDGNLSFGLARTIQPGSGAVTSSGVYRNQRTAGGKKVNHLIDPKTGYPVQNGMLSVTVWAKDATTADAIDNILMVLGPHEILAFLEGHPGIEAYWQFQQGDGRLDFGATPGFMRLLEKHRPVP